MRLVIVHFFLVPVLIFLKKLAKKIHPISRRIQKSKIVFQSVFFSAIEIIYVKKSRMPQLKDLKLMKKVGDYKQGNLFIKVISIQLFFG